MCIKLVLINDKKYLNHSSAFNFKFSIKNCKNVEKQTGKNQTQV